MYACIFNRKLNDTPPKEEKPARGEPSSTDNQAVKRRTGDPRDRIRKEQDSIVLSPQRRSFNSGCFVNVDQLSNRSPESPLRKPEVQEIVIDRLQRLGKECDLIF